ncbi:MAG: hypothetical protein WAO98_05400 [Alphaproteobacteria bacterium]
MCPISFVGNHWEGIKEFFNSVFFISIAGSLAGAFAGAYGGQRIVERQKKREELLKEMRNTNAAIIVAFSICTSLLAMKSQHIKDLKENFDSQKAALLDHRSKISSGQTAKDTTFKFLADFRTLTMPLLPSATLQNQIFEKLSLVGRPLMLTTILIQTLYSLKESLEMRNNLIELYKSNSNLTEKMLVPIYFGLPYDGGHVNQDYPASIDAIYSQTDDGIHFSRLLCQDLVKHGKKIASEFNKENKSGAIRISEPDFSKAEESGLFPDEEKYASWQKMFIEKP